jgi:hypothetical protein
MKYNCKICGWKLEGYTNIMDDILKHEKVHVKDRRE